jgi:hypothetical protein
LLFYRCTRVAVRALHKLNQSPQRGALRPTLPEHTESTEPI